MKCGSDGRHTSCSEQYTGTQHLQGVGVRSAFFSHFLGRSLSVMFKRKYSSGIVL